MYACAALVGSIREPLDVRSIPVQLHPLRTPFIASERKILARLQSTQASQPACPRNRFIVRSSRRRGSFVVVICSPVVLPSLVVVHRFVPIIPLESSRCENMSPHRDGNTLENPAEEYGVNELQDVPPSTANELHAADSDARSLPKRKKKKRPMFDESMTDADRRVIRRQQRQVGFELIQSTSIEDAQKARALNNSIFEKVVYTREAVLDAENVKSITQKLSHHAERQVQVRKDDYRFVVCADDIFVPCSSSVCLDFSGSTIRREETHQ